MGEPAAEWGDTHPIPHPNGHRRGAQVAPIKSSRKSLWVPIGSRHVSVRVLRNPSALTDVRLLGKQAGAAGLACNGGRMGHGHGGGPGLVQRRLQQGGEVRGTWDGGPHSVPPRRA